MRVTLDKVYNFRGVQYGPGDANVPDRIAGLIRRHQEGGGGDTLPEDFPHRELLAKGGITTRAQLADAGDDALLGIDGIAEGRLKEVRKAAKSLKR